jgi:chitinase
MALPPIGNLATLTSQAGIESTTLILIATDGSRRVPSWENRYPVGANNGELRHEINSFVAGDGHSIISFGDAVDNDLASVCDSPTAHETAYQQVINRNQAYALYFDIEGAQLNGTTSANLRNKTFNLLQSDEAARRHAVSISHTLPVLPPGCSLTPCIFAVSGHQA